MQVAQGIGQRRGPGLVRAHDLRPGWDPRIIARRLIAHASEDVGLANPTAMLQAVAAAQALEMVGMPEARAFPCPGHYRDLRKPQVQQRGHGH